MNCLSFGESSEKHIYHLTKNPWKQVFLNLMLGSLIELYILICFSKSVISSDKVSTLLYFKLNEIF